MMTWIFGSRRPSAGEETFKMGDGTVLTASKLSIPKWVSEWTSGTKAMSVEEANSLDSFPRAAEIIDGMIGGWIHRNYNLHIIDLVSRSSNSLMAQITTDREADRYGKRAMRHDLTGKWPDLGEDENGDLRDPTEDELWNFHQEEHWGKNAKRRDRARDDFEDFKLAFEGAKILREIIKYFINCGWTTADVKRELGASQEGKDMGVMRGHYPWGSPEYDKWRRVAWEDMQHHSRVIKRAIAGAFNVGSYAYFRPEATFSSTKYLNPLAIVFALKYDDRRIAALLMIQNYKIELNPALVEQMEKGIVGARTEHGMAPGWGVHLDEGLLKSTVGAPST